MSGQQRRRSSTCASDRSLGWAAAPPSLARELPCARMQSGWLLAAEQAASGPQRHPSLCVQRTTGPAHMHLHLECGHHRSRVLVCTLRLSIRPILPKQPRTIWSCNVLSVYGRRRKNGCHAAPTHTHMACQRTQARACRCVEPFVSYCCCLLPTLTDAKPFALGAASFFRRTCAGACGGVCGGWGGGRGMHEEHTFCVVAGCDGAAWLACLPMQSAMQLEVISQQ